MEIKDVVYGNLSICAEISQLDQFRRKNEKIQLIDFLLLIGFLGKNLSYKL